jgi:hypothetical protein
LAYFQDGDLPALPANVRSTLTHAATRIERIRPVARISNNLADPR